MHLSFYFLLMTLFAVYFIFVLVYGNDVRQKANWAIFLLKFKLGHKAAETTRNINNTFGLGTASEHTVQQWFKKLCKGDESLEDEEYNGWPSEVDNDQLRTIIEADPLTTQEVAEELNINHSTVIQPLKKIGKVKNLNK